MTLGDKIKMHRKALGWTQTELGERLGVKVNAVSKWECGRVEAIPTSKIKTLAKLFDVPPSYLIDDDDAHLSSQSPLDAALTKALDHALAVASDEDKQILLTFIQRIAP